MAPKVRLIPEWSIVCYSKMMHVQLKRTCTEISDGQPLTRCPPQQEVQTGGSAFPIRVAVKDILVLQSTGHLSWHLRQCNLTPWQPRSDLSLFFVFKISIAVKRTHFVILRVEYTKGSQGFPGGAVDKNPPANAGDMGSNPGLGRSHMPRSNKACAPQLLSLCSRACKPQLLSPRATTTEPACLEPMLCNKRSHDNEKPAHRNKE